MNVNDEFAHDLKRRQAVRACWAELMRGYCETTRRPVPDWLPAEYTAYGALLAWFNEPDAYQLGRELGVRSERLAVP